MNAERWQQIEGVFQSALALGGGARADYLAGACAGDGELRQEVESLLAAYEKTGSLVNVPAGEIAARLLTKDQAPAAVGRTITHYKIISSLGAGGMGEVYLAEDTTLGRKVAVKLLPAEFTADTERVRRFAQEARAASALNHPNIITIHEIGEASTESENTHYIVTEYVEGETLRRRIASTSGDGMKLTEAVDAAAQVAAALAAAHEAGITHRDIKPENVMVRPDGIVKVLDFGLAKLTETQALPVDSQVSTVAKLSTEAGMVMGTPGYMSPEQARGERVDARTDIFSLGVMLYEMVAGRAPFAGATTSETIAALLRDEPPPLTVEAPPELERIIGKALKKDYALRTYSAREMLADLKQLQRHLSSGRAAAMQPVASAPINAVRQPARQRKWAVIAAVPVVILAGLLLWQWRRPLESPKVTNYIPVTTDGTVFDSPTPSWMMTMVTDGPRLYYSIVANGRVVLNQISSAGGEAVTLPTPFQNALLMDISPSRSELLLANFTVGTELEGPLWILPIPGGSPRRLGDVRAHAAAWSPNGQQVVYANGSELFLADSNGAGSRKLLSAEGRAYWLRWSPDGKRLRFSVRRNQISGFLLWEVNADGTNLHPLLPGWSAGPGGNAPAAQCCGNWTADGKYFVFQVTRNPMVSLWALRENAGGAPVQLTFGPLNFRAPVPSADGRRLFAIGERQRGELVRYDKRTEQWLPYLSGISAHLLSFSRDGEWMTYVTYPEGSLWRSRVDGTERLQLSFPPMQAHQSRWSPDGKQIAFLAMPPGQVRRIHIVSADGGASQPLTPEEIPATDPSWSPDGAKLAFASASTPEKRAIYLLDLRTGQIAPLPSAESVFSPRWSPDGQSIAAMSVNGGKLLLFDLTTKQWTQLTDVNVSYPQWSRDGKYIYFANQFRNDSSVMRLRLNDRRLERWADLKDLRLASSFFGRWMGLAPDDSPLVLRDVGPQDIYALEWQAP